MKKIILALLVILLVLPLANAKDVTFSIDLGDYYVSEKSERFVCSYESTQIKPVIGLLFFGNTLNYVSLEKNKLSVSQNFAGNKFIIPVTYDGCDKIKNRINSFYFTGFIPLAEKTVLIMLKYSDIKISGGFSKNTPINLLLRKNDFSEIEVSQK